MSDAHFLYHASEYVGEVEITDVQAENQRVESAKFAQDLQDLRDTVRQKLLGHGALSGENGWAIFRTDERNDRTGLMVYGSYKEILVVHGIRTAKDPKFD